MNWDVCIYFQGTAQFSKLRNQIGHLHSHPPSHYALHVVIAVITAMVKKTPSHTYTTPGRGTSATGLQRNSVWGSWLT